MGSDEKAFMLLGLFILILFLLGMGVGRLFRPRCKTCGEGRLIIVDSWDGNDKLRCDHCGDECWNLRL